jgi:hypothetical protein
MQQKCDKTPVQTVDLRERDYKGAKGAKRNDYDATRNAAWVNLG